MAASAPPAAWSVGARVRVTVPAGSGGTSARARRRGVVATLPDAGAEACVLLDAVPAAPRGPWLRGGSGNRRHAKKVLEDDAEVNIPAVEMEGLLDFETGDTDDDENDSATVATCKDRGDALLRLGDALAAIGYYEASLRRSSQISVGGTVVVRQQGFTRLAEVDCYEAKDRPIDVSMVHDGAEVTVRPGDSLICILDPDEERIQERVLLNLARCCLQAAELVSLQERSQFRRSAVLACTLALDISNFHNGGDTSDTAQSSTTITALTLRSKAQKLLSRYDHARADLRRLVAMAPQHAEGQRLMRQLQRDIQKTKRTDKKLVKELCKWVDTATNQSVSEQDEEDGDPGARQSMMRASPAPRAAPQSSSHHAYLSTGVSWMVALVVVVIAYFLQATS